MIPFEMCGEQLRLQRGIPPAGACCTGAWPLTEAQRGSASAGRTAG